MNLIITGQSMPENCGKCFYNPYCEVYIKAWSEKPSIRYSFGQHNRLQNCPLIEQVPAIPMERIKQLREELYSRYPKNVFGGLELGGCACHYSWNEISELIDNMTKEYSE